MVNSTALMLILWPHMLQQPQSIPDVIVPFTHDFNTGLNGWYYEPEFWDWTGDATRSPDTTNITSFYSNGNHIWTQENVPMPHNDSAPLILFKAALVSRSTKFTFRYWFSSLNPDENTGLFIYIMDLAQEGSFSPVEIITDNSDNWKDLTIDCAGTTCCKLVSPFECSVQIQIFGSVGTSSEDGIASIICVSTEDGGCGTLPTSPTTTVETTIGPSTTKAPNPPPPNSSPLASAPNLLVMATFILMWTVQSLFR